MEDDDLPGALNRYVDRVVRTVPGCDHALITVSTPNGTETVAGASLPGLADGWVEPTDLPNPIGEVLTYREPRRLADLGTDRRWPEFAARAVGSGFRSALALPIAAVTEPSAAMTLLSREPDRFADTTYDVVMLFVVHAGVVFDNVSLYNDSRSMLRNLRAALVTRSTIGQAQGLLMRRHGLSAGRSFDLLRKASQERNVKLRDLAESLVTAHDEHRLDAALREAGLEPAQ
ncbi:MAG: GAF and ANTAR domain-containing protein [Pseudonocardia sp.]|nr:GAF and ANTAR domain-containing protein [Pseudonocardia sp.]MBO0877835.1 GAF and ANTAR domain-containing protein [Pseudonocardia sp.]